MLSRNQVLVACSSKSSHVRNEEDTSGSTFEHLAGRRRQAHIHVKLDNVASRDRSHHR